MITLDAYRSSCEPDRDWIRSAAHWRKTSLTSIPSRTRMDLILSTARSEPLMFILPSLSAIRGRRFSGSRATRFTPVSMTA